jgi:hypothetical protein
MVSKILKYRNCEEDKVTKNRKAHATAKKCQNEFPVEGDRRYDHPMPG